MSFNADMSNGGNPQKKRLKVLLGCYACSPYYGSEKGMGWNFLRHIAQYCDVHAIVEEMEDKPDLERYAAEHPEEFEHITLHYVRKVRHPLLRKIWPPIYYHFYDGWQKRAYKLAVELEKRENFDLVHQITLAGYREPGYLWKLGKPFIWGTLGGLNNTAWGLLKGLNMYQRLYFSARNLLNTIQKRGRRVRAAARHADTIYVCDVASQRDVAHYWNRKATIMSEIGVSCSERTENPTRHMGGTPLRVCWVGNLIPLKGLPMLLAALPLCKQPIELHVLGKGPKKEEYQALAERLGVAGNVIFHGSLPHADVFPLMRSCHALCISSIKEGGTSTVTLEAMQCALPVVALNHCGFADVITEQCGIRIPVTNPKRISRDFAVALDSLAADEARRYALAQGAAKRAQDYTWEAKTKLMMCDYAAAVAAHCTNFDGISAGMSEKAIREF